MFKIEDIHSNDLFAPISFGGGGGGGAESRPMGGGVDHREPDLREETEAEYQANRSNPNANPPSGDGDAYTGDHTYGGSDGR